MAKKQETKTKVEPTPQVVKQPKVETPVMDIPEPKVRERKKPKDEWEIKDRMYILILFHSLFLYQNNKYQLLL